MHDAFVFQSRRPEIEQQRPLEGTPPHVDAYHATKRGKGAGTPPHVGAYHATKRDTRGVRLVDGALRAPFENCITTPMLGACKAPLLGTRD